MTSMNANTEVLKQDVRGRVRVSAERREALLDEFERSGASGAKFARLAGIKYATFANWVTKRRRERGCGDALREQCGGPAALKWVEAVPEDVRPPAAVCNLAADARRYGRAERRRQPRDRMPTGSLSRNRGRGWNPLRGDLDRAAELARCSKKAKPGSCTVAIRRERSVKQRPSPRYMKLQGITVIP
jgi:hypothetical protein